MQKIRLEKFNDDNFYEIVNLKVKKEQKNFLANNFYSIVHTYLASLDGKSAYPFGIYKGDKAIGFLLIGFNVIKKTNNPVCDWFIENNYIIWRFMIDKRYQGKGYAKEAMQLALDFIRTFPCGKAEYCWLSYDIENTAARNLYKSFNFEEVPSAYIEGGEMPAVLKL